MPTLLIAPADGEALAVTPGTPFDLVVQTDDASAFAFDAPPVATLYDANAVSLGAILCTDITRPADPDAAAKTFAITVPASTASGSYSVQFLGYISTTPYAFAQAILIGGTPNTAAAPPPDLPPSPTDTAWRRAVARFVQEVQARGVPLTVTRAGAWTREPHTGAVAQAAPSLATAQNVMGLFSARYFATPWLTDKIDKWGNSFLPDAIVLVPITVDISQATQFTDWRTGKVYSVIAPLPDETGEAIFHTLYLRDGPVFNKTVSVSVDSRDDDTKATLFTNLPCRLTPIHGRIGGGLEGDDWGIVPRSVQFLECPYVVEGADVLAAGVDAGGVNGVEVAAGARIFFDAQLTTVIDNPTAYGLTGIPLTFRVVSPNLDPGGDLSFQRYIVSLVED